MYFRMLLFFVSLFVVSGCFSEDTPMQHGAPVQVQEAPVAPISNNPEEEMPQKNSKSNPLVAVTKWLGLGIGSVVVLGTAVVVAKKIKGKIEEATSHASQANTQIQHRVDNIPVNTTTSVHQNADKSGGTINQPNDYVGKVIDVLVPIDWIGNEMVQNRIQEKLALVGINNFTWKTFTKSDAEASVSPTADLILCFWTVADRIDEVRLSYDAMRKLNSKIIFLFAAARESESINTHIDTFNERQYKNWIVFSYQRVKHKQSKDYYSDLILDDVFMHSLRERLADIE